MIWNWNDKITIYHKRFYVTWICLIYLFIWINLILIFIIYLVKYANEFDTSGIIIEKWNDNE